MTPSFSMTLSSAATTPLPNIYQTSEVKPHSITPQGTPASKINFQNINSQTPPTLKVASGSISNY